VGEFFWGVCGGVVMAGGLCRGRRAGGLVLFSVLLSGLPIVAWIGAAGGALILPFFFCRFCFQTVAPHTT